MIDYTFWQFNTMGYHMTSAFIHILNAFLVFLLLLNLLDANTKEERSAKCYVAFVAAMMWLIHPVHTQKHDVYVWAR